MKISEKQLAILFQTTVDSLRLNLIGPGFIITDQERQRVVNEILGQQSGEVVSVGTDKPTEKKEE